MLGCLSFDKFFDAKRLRIPVLNLHFTGYIILRSCPVTLCSIISFIFSQLFYVTFKIFVPHKTQLRLCIVFAYTVSMTHKTLILPSFGRHIKIFLIMNHTFHSMQNSITFIYL